MKKIFTLILIALFIAGFLIIQDLRAHAPYKISGDYIPDNALNVSQ